MPAVIDNAARSRFELDVEGETAFAEYRLSPGVMIFTHTLTPRALRGRGIAGQVVHAALEHARADGLKVVPQCWYVAQYIQQHPEFADLLEQR